LDTSIICWFREFSGVFTVEDVGGAGDKGSGDTTMVDVQTPLEAFLTSL